MSTNLNQGLWKAGNVPCPSDNLRPLYALCDKSAGFAKILEMPQRIRLVIDTNVVIQELLFVARSRRNASARTNLREAMDSGVLVTIAPNKVHEEVNRHISRLAFEKSVPEERLHEAWEDFKAQIEFRDVEENAIPPAGVADPDDVPFVSLYWASGADAVLTEDRNISMMGARTVRPDAMLHVRDYARSKSPEVTLRVGGLVISGVAVGAVVGLAKLVSAIVRTFSKLPVELQVLLVAGAILLALHPSSRKMVSNNLSALAELIRGPAGLFVAAIDPLTVKLGEARLELKAKQDIVESVIPRR